MMAAKKKKGPEKNGADTIRAMRDDAEKQLECSQKITLEMKGEIPAELIHELQVHQIELETQAEELRRAHLALEESREKYLDLYEFAPLGYLTLNDKALITEVNLNGATLLGVERSKLVGARFSKFIAEKDADVWHRYFVNVLKQDEKQCCTLTLRRDDGFLFPARLESIRISGSSKGTPAVRVALSDISDIRRAEDALRESGERYRRITEGLTDYLYTVRVQDGQAVSTMHGAACVAVTGYTAEEFAADPYLWIRMVFDEDRDRVNRHVDAVLKGKPVPPVEHRIVRKDGQHRWVRDTPVLQLDAGGRLVSYDGVIKDITVTKHAEEALQKNTEELRASCEQLTASEEQLKAQFEELTESQRALVKSEERFRLTLDATNDGIWDWNILKGTTFFSPHWYTMLGYEPGEMPASHATWRSLTHPGDLDKAEQMMKDHIRTHAGYAVELRMRTKQGDWRWILSRGRVIEQDRDGNPARVIGTHTDITERKQAEEQLNKTVDELRRFNNLTVDRELRMIALKQEINALLKNAGNEEKYRTGP